MFPRTTYAKSVPILYTPAAKILLHSTAPDMAHDRGTDALGLPHGLQPGRWDNQACNQGITNQRLQSATFELDWH